MDGLRRAAEKAVELTCARLAEIVDSGAAQQYGISESELSAAQSAPRDSPLPDIARVDLVASAGQVRILEVNADSPAGIHHFSTLADLLHHSWPMIDNAHVDYLDGRRAMDRAVETISSRLDDRDDGKIAIVESQPEKWPSWHEMQVFAEKFREFTGRETVVCDPETLALDPNGHLHHEGSRIALVYKRALWRHLKGDGAESLLHAAEAGRVVVANSLFSRLAGNKRLMVDLWANNGNLADGAFVTETYVADLANPALKRRVSREANEWVAKSFRGYGANEITMRKSRDSLASWESSIDQVFGYDPPSHIIQRRFPHASFTVATPFAEPQRLEAVFGAYVIGGTCVGIEAKVSPSLPISMSSDGAARGIVGTLRPKN